MTKFYNNFDAFQKICGDCCGVEDITEKDIREQAATWAEQGDPCSEEMVEAAIKYLKEN
jgi:predicted HD phosphohydrolase